MILGEVIQRIQSLYSKGVQSDDSRLTSRHIYNSIITARSSVLRQMLNKNQKVSDWLYQSLPCVELVKAPITECPCIPANGCSILRTKYKLPNPITGINDMEIRAVTTMDGGIRLDPTTFENVKYLIGNKFTGKKPHYYIKNEYLYVTSLKALRGIVITGLWGDPVEAQQFPSLCSDCENCNCVDIMDTDFPVDNDLMKTIIQMVADELISVFRQMDSDDQNNAEDDTKSLGLIHQPKGDS